jgi:hypothetical protein
VTAEIRLLNISSHVHQEDVGRRIRPTAFRAPRKRLGDVAPLLEQFLNF